MHPALEGSVVRGDIATFARRPTGDDRFVARNFLLDENLREARVDAYLSFTDGVDGDIREWAACHQDYLEAHVWVSPAKGAAPPPMVMAEDAWDIAQTFRERVAEEAPREEATELLRIERLSGLRGAFSSSAADQELLIEWLEQVTSMRTQSVALASKVDAVLSLWRRDRRPVWATAYADVARWLPPNPGSSDDWAADLRDALGLVIPEGEQIVVFKYAVRDVPRLGRDHLLCRPTVLDGPFAPAFVPTPSNDVMGRALQLREGNAPGMTEILHPPFQLRAQHVVLIGEIGRPSSARLALARREHLELLRTECNRADYARGTDSDL
jgi:hypothetical protein